MPIYKLEGFAILRISLRLKSERTQKLNDLLQKLGIEPLKDSDNVSDKLRLFIDNLYEVLIEKPVKSERAKGNSFPQVNFP